MNKMHSMPYKLTETVSEDTIDRLKAQNNSEVNIQLHPVFFNNDHILTNPVNAKYVLISSKIARSVHHLYRKDIEVFKQKCRDMYKNKELPQRVAIEDIEQSLDKLLSTVTKLYSDQNSYAMYKLTEINGTSINSFEDLLKAYLQLSVDIKFKAKQQFYLEYLAVATSIVFFEVSVDKQGTVAINYDNYRPHISTFFNDIFNDGKQITKADEEDFIDWSVYDNFNAIDESEVKQKIADYFMTKTGKTANQSIDKKELSFRAGLIIKQRDLINKLIVNSIKSLKAYSCAPFTGTPSQLQEKSLAKLGFGPDSVHLWYVLTPSNKASTAITKGTDIRSYTIEDYKKVVNQIINNIDRNDLHITLWDWTTGLQVKTSSFKVLDDQDTKIDLNVTLDPATLSDAVDQVKMLKNGNGCIFKLDIILHGKSDKLKKKGLNAAVSYLLRRNSSNNISTWR